MAACISTIEECPMMRLSWDCNLCFESRNALTRALPLTYRSFKYLKSSIACSRAWQQYYWIYPRKAKKHHVCSINHKFANHIGCKCLLLAEQFILLSPHLELLQVGLKIELCLPPRGLQKLLGKPEAGYGPLDCTPILKDKDSIWHSFLALIQVAVRASGRWHSQPGNLKQLNKNGTLVICQVSIEHDAMFWYHTCLHFHMLLSPTCCRLSLQMEAQCDGMMGWWDNREINQKHRKKNK